MPTAEPRITLNPAVLDGKPVVRGTRPSVEHVIGLLADGWSEQDILADYPGLIADDIKPATTSPGHESIAPAPTIAPSSEGPWQSRGS